MQQDDISPKRAWLWSRCVSISTQPETKTMTHTPVYVVGVTYMLM